MFREWFPFALDLFLLSRGWLLKLALGHHHDLICLPFGSAGQCYAVLLSLRLVRSLRAIHAAVNVVPGEDDVSELVLQNRGVLIQQMPFRVKDGFVRNFFWFNGCHIIILENLNRAF